MNDEHRPSTAKLGRFLDQTNPTEPHQEIRVATKRIEALAYTQGMDQVLTRMETLIASTTPGSVTKAQLLAMLRREIDTCVARWERDIKPQCLR